MKHRMISKLTKKETVSYLFLLERCRVLVISLTRSCLFDYLWNVKNHAVNVGSEILVSIEDCWNPILWLLIRT